jgi:hypothetical protein
MLDSRLRALIANMHSISEEATGFEDELANLEAYTVILMHHLRESAKHLTGMEPAGLCANCAWPLWRKNGDLMHYDYTYKLGNKCKLPVLAEERT